ncbi:hypothetical protein GYH30_002932 [Glycine max]|nr:hypothetical protein JHK87_002946 [Glycine soja]KAH1058586.1 hypothetical protein GYH30_002932 [Glycine max]
MKMTRIFLSTLSLCLLLLQLNLSKAQPGSPQKLPFTFHSLFPFFGRPEDANIPLKGPQDDLQNVPQQAADQKPQKLSQDFYIKTCPNAQKIVADALADIVKKNPGALGNLLRLQFHDCFVNGCDASILLDYSPSGDTVEKSSMVNGLLLKGADMIDDIKLKLEEQCPQTVSCADTLAFTANEVMTMAGLPPRKPLGGRRDALVSLSSAADADNLPLPDWTMDQMVKLFTKKGFNIEEMVILLGAHSIGMAHCDLFIQRAYNFQNTGKPDPTLTVEAVEEFKKACPNVNTPKYRNPPVNFDATPTVLDNLFYMEMVERNRTFLITDSHLLTDQRTLPLVQQFAHDPSLFPRRFPEVMLKLGSLNVLTGNEGEIRKICRSTN